MESSDFLKAHLKHLEIARKGQAASVPATNVAPESIQTGPPQVGQPALAEIFKEPVQ
jgi:hypothetical protein